MTEPKIIKNPVKAIRAFCLDCIGSYEAVKQCTATTCAVYAFRSGKNPYRTKRVMTEEQKATAAARFAKARAVKQEQKAKDSFLF